MAKNTYQKSGEDLAVLISEAKIRQGIKDETLCDRLDMAKSTIRNMRSQKRLPMLPFWKVLLIAEMAGYSVRFEKK
jgi:ribosome-binding protein aMBF1 (putative translation factor)